MRVTNMHCSNYAAIFHINRGWHAICIDYWLLEKIYDWGLKMLQVQMRVRFWPNLGSLLSSQIFCLCIQLRSVLVNFSFSYLSIGFTSQVHFIAIFHWAEILGPFLGFYYKKSSKIPLPVSLKPMHKITIASWCAICETKHGSKGSKSIGFP